MKAATLLVARSNFHNAARTPSARLTTARCLQAGRTWSACQTSHAGYVLPMRWQSGTASPPVKNADVFPEHLNVYRAGSTADLAVGFGRLLTIGFFFYGTFLVAPPLYFDPSISNWWIPSVIIGSATPMVATALGSTPLVHDIKVRLPAWARRSRQDLLRFIRNVPPETVIKATFMRWAPWPRTEEMVFRDLRRLKQEPKTSWKAGVANRANLEWHSPATGSVDSKSTGGQKGDQYRFFIKRDQKKDMSASPGLWDLMWPQISEATGNGVVKARKHQAHEPQRLQAVHPALRRQGKK